MLIRIIWSQVGNNSVWHKILSGIKKLRNDFSAPLRSSGWSIDESGRKIEIVLVLPDYFTKTFDYIFYC